MKILQINYGFFSGSPLGTEVYTRNISNELSKNNEVFIFSRASDTNIQEYNITQHNLNRIKIFAINNTFRLCNSFEDTYRNTAIAEKFTLVLDSIKPDIVHIQHLLYLSVCFIKEIKKRKIPVVWTLHDYWLLCPQGQFLKDNALVCSGKNTADCLHCVSYQLGIKKNVFKIYYLAKKIFPERLFQLAKKIYLNRCCRGFKNDTSITERLRYIKAFCSAVDLFISPSKFLKSKFIEFGMKSEKIALMPYGFDFGKFKFFKKSVSDNLRIGFIGNFIPAKGLHILIEAFNKIRSERIELKIFGRDSAYKSILVNYAKLIRNKAKVNKNIKFLGGFDNENIAEILSGIDVLAVPSIWLENSPLVIQEAFIAKTPVIASNIGGIPELVSDRVNGLLFKPGNAQDLKEKLEYVINNPGILEKFEKNMPVIKNIEDNAKELERLYSNLTKKLNFCL